MCESLLYIWSKKLLVSIARMAVAGTLRRALALRVVRSDLYK